MTAVILHLHKKKAAEIFAASKGWMRFEKIYPNIIVGSKLLFDNSWETAFLNQSKLIFLKYEGQQSIY